MRQLVADIKLNNLLENYLYLRKQHGGQLLAVLKANAYGHGSVACAKALSEVANGFAVAFLDEALVLREAGIVQPILLLGGVFDSAELLDVARYGLWMVVHNESQLQMLLAANIAKPIAVWLKMDSGMHRAGFSPENYINAYKRLIAHKNVSRIIKMTHLACADETSSNMTAWQTKLFDATCSELAGEVSIANSAAILAYPITHRDWGRAGIALYGVSPFAESKHNLQPVMSFYTQIFDVRELASGESIGYGATFTTKRRTRVGLIACGYADGYPRSAATGTPVYVDGYKSSVLGRVSMDVMSIDLTELSANVGKGSLVELWGEMLSVNEVARCAGSISYELLCNVKRSQKRYV